MLKMLKLQGKFGRIPGRYPRFFKNIFSISLVLSTFDQKGLKLGKLWKMLKVAGDEL